MESGATNLTQPQDQNLTSAIGFCGRSFKLAESITNLVFVIYSLPSNLFVIMELLKRNYRKKNDGSLSFTLSLSEIFLLHLSVIGTCYCFSVLLLLVEGLNLFWISGNFIDALYSPRFSAGPLLLVAICVDSYLAVVHPVAYIAAKNLRHRGLLYTTPVWVYAFVIWLITIMYHLNYYHPICMLSFYVSLPTVVFFSLSTLKALYSAGPRNSNQTLSPIKRKAFHIILSILVGMILYYLPQVSFFTYRFIKPTDPVRFACFEYPIVMLLPTFCDFAAPLLFLYCVGKLGTTFCSINTN